MLCALSLVQNTVFQHYSDKGNCFASNKLSSLTFSPHGMQEFEVIHGHLQDFRFLQLG